MPRITVEDYLSPRGQKMTMEEYLQYSPMITMEDYLSSGYKQTVPAPAELPIPSPIDTGLNFLTQGMMGAAESLSFGLASKETEFEPQTPAESIGRGIGNLVGFVKGPLKVGSLLGRPVAKNVGIRLAAAAGDNKTAFAAANVLEHGLSQMAPMAIAEGMSAAGRGENALKGVGSGALLGATFAATQLINPKNHIIAMISRQLGGRALLSVTGQVDYEEALKQPNIAQTVWHEMLNTWFFRHGIKPEDVLTGNFRNPKDRVMVEALTDAVNGRNSEVERGFKRSETFAIESLRKPEERELELREVYIDESKLDSAAVTEMERSLSKNPKLTGVVMNWDPEIGKYTSNNNNLLLAYLNLRFELKKIDQDTSPIKFKVMVAATPEGAPTKLATPAEVALKYLNDLGANLSESLIRQAGVKSSRYVIVNVGGPDTKKPSEAVRVMPHSIEARGEQSLRAGQVMVEVDTNGKGKIVAVGKGALEKNLIERERFVPTPAQRSRELAIEDEYYKLLAEQERGVKDPAINQRLDMLEKDLEKFVNQRIPEKVLLAGYTGKIETKSGKRFDARDTVAKAEAVIKSLRQFPLMEAPREYMVGLETALKELDMGGWEVKSFLKAVKATGDDGRLTLDNMNHVDQVIEALKQRNTGQERHASIAQYLLSKYGIKKPVLKTGTDLWYDQQDVESQRKGVIKRYWEAANKAAKEDPSGGSAIQRMLVITKARAIRDYRMAAMDIEEKTGIPLYSIHIALSEGRAAKYKEQTAYEERLLPFLRMPQEEQINIRKYYLSKYLRTDDYVSLRAGMPERSIKMLNMLDGVFKDMEPDIINYRFQVWYDSTYDPARRGIGGKRDNVFRRQDDPDIQNLLQHGATAYAFKSTRPELFQEWLVKAREARLGLVEEGRYLPLEIFGLSPGTLERSNLLWHIDAAGRGRTLSRGNIRDSAVDDMIAGFGHNKDLVLSVKNYISQVLTLKHLSNGLNALNDVAEAYPEMRVARRPGFMRKGPESRAYTTEEYLKLYTMRLKGYPVKLSMFEGALKDVQLMFFRGLVVRPVLWMRNLMQAGVNFPSKKFLDPRFTLFRFSKLPKNIKDWLHTRGIDDADAFDHSFLELETNLRIGRVPILGKIWDIAGQFGKNYAKTDSWNRRFVYATTWFRSKYFTEKYSKGEIGYEKLRNALDVDKLHPLEQVQFKKSLENKNTDDAAFQIAKWQTDNSQWKYSRYERGLEEMTGGGESLSNLFTWSKSMVQHTADMGNKFWDASKRYSYAADPYAKRSASRQMLHSASDIAGIMIAGAVSNGIYETITVSHGGKFAPYGADMFTWQFGGVTGQILTELTAKSAAVVSAFDGTKEEKGKAISDWVKMIDNIGLRQMFPFMKQTLSVIESLTDRSYISPLSTLVSKMSTGYWRNLEKVDRTFLEGITHGIFGTDPNKSEDIRKFTYFKLQDLRSRSLMTSGATKAWYDLRVEQYEYLNDLFMRFQPIDVMRKSQQDEDARYTDKAVVEYERKAYAREKKNYE